MTPLAVSLPRPCWGSPVRTRTGPPWLAMSGEQVEAILARRQAALQEIRCKVQPTVERHLDAARDEIAAVLTPEQAETWHAHFTRLRDTWVPPLPPQDP